MKIGLLGLTFNSGNKGCEALSYSCLEMLNTIARKRGEIIQVYIVGALHLQRFFKYRCSVKKLKRELLPQNDYSNKYNNLKIDVAYYKKVKNHYIFLPSLSKCDSVIDYTAGDSFTDIYGDDRFISWTNIKEAVVKHKIPLIMGSQTIGPFLSEKNKEYASGILNQCKAIFVRDELSYNYTVKISKVSPILTSDIAFLLPYKKTEIKSDKIKVGINPSGLLWNDGYTGNNEFGLSVDYKRYCRSLIEQLLEMGNYEIHLILHAYYEGTGYPDNDLDAVSQLHQEFPETICAPHFKTPMEAKGYIAAMDVFTGARMHATIASFSAGVAVIPFSYSRKFEGLFNSIGYDNIIHGTSDDTDFAIQKTIDLIQHLKMISDDVKHCVKEVNKKTDFLISQTEDVLYQ